MKITGISLQAKNVDRVNVSVDGSYRFSLDVFQVGELGLKIGNEYTEEELVELESESQFGKLYVRTLEYSLLRPHSAKEVKDYLWRKTRTTKVRSRTTNEVYDKPGVDPAIADRVFNRLQERGYVDDLKFTRFWVENRNQVKGMSRRKLTAELRTKGIDHSVIDSVMFESARSDDEELLKVLAKKRSKYDDDQKLIAYLARQGFGYDDIKRALNGPD